MSGICCGSICRASSSFSSYLPSYSDKSKAGIPNRVESALFLSEGTDFSIPCTPISSRTLTPCCPDTDSSLEGHPLSIANRPPESIPILKTKWGDPPPSPESPQRSEADSSSGVSSSSQSHSRQPASSRGRGSGSGDYPEEWQSSYSQPRSQTSPDKRSHSYINQSIKNVLAGNLETFGRAIFNHRSELKECCWLEQFALNAHHAKSLCSEKQYRSSPARYGWGEDEGFRYYLEYYLLNPNYRVGPDNRALRFLTVLYEFPGSHPLKSTAYKIISLLEVEVQEYFHHARAALVKQAMTESRNLVLNVSPSAIHRLFLERCISEEIYIGLLQCSRTHRMTIDDIYRIGGEFAIPVLKELITDKSQLSPFIRHILDSNTTADSSDSKLRCYLCAFKQHRHTEYRDQILATACSFRVISLEDLQHIFRKWESDSWIRDVMLQLWNLKPEAAHNLVNAIDAPECFEYWPSLSLAGDNHQIRENILHSLVSKLTLLPKDDIQRALFKLAVHDNSISFDPSHLIGKTWNHFLTIFLDMPLPALLLWLHIVQTLNSDWRDNFLTSVDNTSKEKIQGFAPQNRQAMATRLGFLANRIGWLNMAVFDNGFIRTFISKKLLVSVPSFLLPIESADAPQNRKKYFIKALQQLIQNAAHVSSPVLPPPVEHALTALIEYLQESGQSEFTELILNSLDMNDRSRLEATLQKKMESASTLPKTQNAEFWREMFLITWETLQNSRSEAQKVYDNLTQVLGSMSPEKDPSTPGPSTLAEADHSSSESVAMSSRPGKRVQPDQGPATKSKRVRIEEADSTSETQRLREQNATLQTALLQLQQKSHRQQEELSGKDEKISAMIEEQKALENSKVICRICDNPYSDDRRAYAYPCGHVFCLPCIEAAIYISSSPSDSDDSIHSKSPPPDNKKRCMGCREKCQKEDIKPVYLSC